MVKLIKKLKRKFNTVYDIIMAILMYVFFIGGGIWVMVWALTPLIQTDHNYKNYTVEGEYTFKYIGTRWETHTEGSNRSRGSSMQSFVKYYYPTYSGEIRGQAYNYSVYKKFSESQAESFGASYPTWEITAYLSNKDKIYILGSSISLKDKLNEGRVIYPIVAVFGFLFFLLGVIDFVQRYFGKNKNNQNNNKNNRNKNRKNKKKNDDYDDFDEDSDDDDEYYDNKKRRRRNR